MPPLLSNSVYARAVLERLRDPLYRNALFLQLTSGIAGTSGFFFWLIAERGPTPPRP